jgi:hypothetical protein
MANNKKQRLEQIVRRDLANGDAIDHYVLYLRGQGELEPKEQDMMAKYELVMNLARSGNRISDIVAVLTKGVSGIMPVQRRQAFQIVEDAQYIFGEVFDTNNKFRTWASIEFYDMIAKKALDLGDLASAIKAREKADELSGIFELNNQGLNPDDFTNPDAWVTEVTSDVKALQEAEGMEEETENAEFEFFNMEDYE